MRSMWRLPSPVSSWSTRCSTTAWTSRSEEQTPSSSPRVMGRWLTTSCSRTSGCLIPHTSTASPGGSTVGGHPDRGIPGIIASTGSLGHGLPLALGIARGKREHSTPGTVFVVMSDGELMEGSVWEALLLGPSLGITNVTVIIDHNGSISRGDIMKVQPNLIPVAPSCSSAGTPARSTATTPQPSSRRCAQDRAAHPWPSSPEPPRARASATWRTSPSGPSITQPRGIQAGPVGAC